MIERYNIGDHVLILGSDKGCPYDKTTGMIGIVEKGGSSSVGVRLNGMNNKSSGYGVFWYKYYELKLTDECITIKREEENNMSLIESGATSVIRVRFVEGYNTDKKYNFLCYDEVKVGDFVVADSNGTGTFAKVEEVVTIEDAIAINMQATKEIMCVCDFSEYNKRKEVKEKKAELKKQMDKRIKELQTSQIYEMFAEKDDTLKELLEQYKGI